ncbi:MAG: GGDEF domain-containing protein [Methylococcaceae bacterium]|nr:GGDEF domain-containing protein [Methylococcaceae bacterium]MCI0668771.1 GGDEF domain-containing protein [Methylococcaceae bacterium]
MNTEHSKKQALIYVADLPEHFRNELEDHSGNLKVAATFRALARDLIVSEHDHEPTLVLFDPECPEHGTGDYAGQWSNIFQKAPCIAIYRSTPPDIQDLSEYTGLRDLLPISAIDRITFAINREIDTQLLSEELQQKSDLLKKMERTRLILPEFDRQLPPNIESEHAQFPTWILTRQEFIKYLNEHLYILNQNNHASLALIEIDHYKSVSASEENEFNKRCMEVVANIILARCRPIDVLAYFDKKVFALFSTSYSPRTVPTFAEHLRLSISESLLEGENDFIQLKCSIGICFWSVYIANTAELIARAQQACAKASIGDGNRVQIYQTLATSFEVLSEQSKYKEQVGSALKEDRFRLVYQPIVHLQQFNEESYAILLRMLDRTGKHLSPDRFLPIAESTGLIEYIDQWVIQQSVELARRSGTRKQNRNFFLKISGYSLSSEKLQKCLEYYLKKAKIDGSSLVFQIDYSEYIHNPQRVKAFMQNVAELKCKVAFDHFGFGEYSLSELTELPLDFIKIDGTFSRGLVTTRSYQKTIQAIQHVAETAQIKTVAKSVENANTLALLWNLGVDYVQGYFVQEPHDKMQFNFVAVI